MMIHPEWNVVVPNPRALIVLKHEIMWFSQAFIASFPDTRVNAGRASWNLCIGQNIVVLFVC